MRSTFEGGRGGIRVPMKNLNAFELYFKHCSKFFEWPRLQFRLDKLLGLPEVPKVIDLALILYPRIKLRTKKVSANVRYG